MGSENRERTSASGLRAAAANAVERLEGRVLLAGSVLGRHAFYNASFFDGNNPAANATDDNATAPDKTALLPGQRATFSKYTSYARGLNGITVNVAGAPGSLDAADFAFRVGNAANPSAWTRRWPRPTCFTSATASARRGTPRRTRW